MIIAVVLVARLMGFLSSVDAIFNTRTSQGAIAWAVVLNTFPYVAVPAWWVLGRSRFQGYVTARQEEERQENPHEKDEADPRGQGHDHGLAVGSEPRFQRRPGAHPLSRLENRISVISRVPPSRPGRLPGGCRPREQVTLRIGGARRPKRRRLGFRFHADGDHARADAPHAARL